MTSTITQLNPQNFTLNFYEPNDTSLISTFEISSSLTNTSVIEFFIYDLNNNIIYENYSFNNYSVINDLYQNNTISNIIIEPDKILDDLGYNQGEYITYFNILNKKIGDNANRLFISEISSDRTELRLSSNTIDDLITPTLNFIEERENSDYFYDFYINFDSNNLLISNNIQLDSQDPNNPSILIKLYDPLPSEFDINSQLWVASNLEEPLAYNVKFDDEIIEFTDTIQIQSPNFNIEFKDQVNNSTNILSYNDIINSPLTSSNNQINSLLEEKGIEINIDYSDFSNFIHFSSAQHRLENFYNKMVLLEQYSSSISVLTTVASSSIPNNNILLLNDKINNIISNFDGYEYELYFTSGSYTWPKTNQSPPYINYPSTDPIVLSWFGSTNEYSPSFGGIIYSASIFDDSNKDILLNSIPSYLREDDNNIQYETFINMIAHHFDNIWVYYKDVSEKYDADNRLEFGVSKDIVVDAIRDFGIKIYQNNFSNNDLYTSFLGLTADGGTFPFPYITDSLPTPQGYEFIDTLISASNDTVPLDDINKSIYKRIYHNLPYLLKSKGTLTSLKTLINTYGIPDTILKIREFGGQDKNNINDWDYWENKFNYKFNLDGTNSIETQWKLNSSFTPLNDVPGAISFRIIPTTPTSSINQTIWHTDGDVYLTLSNAYTSSLPPYSGSTIGDSNKFGTLTFYPNIANQSVTASINAPFFNGDWWSILINRKENSFTLTAKQKFYEGGYNNTKIGFQYSSSINASSTPWVNSNTSSFGEDGTTPFKYFKGDIQEIRYYRRELGDSYFNDYVMNPNSITFNEISNILCFRASLGGELYTGSTSIHPRVTGSFTNVNSFPSSSDFLFKNNPIFLPNTEYIFPNQPITGIKSSISDKIIIEDNILPLGETLSQFRRISQNTENKSNYSPHINSLEVAFSPQNEINDDITNTLGNFNIGEYIGDPQYRTNKNTSYVDLNEIRDQYFQKYTKNYNLKDYINLIKYFDNSLFKMIKDFTPARTSLSSGIVIKQHLLERNRIPQNIITQENNSELSSSFVSQWSGYDNTKLVGFNGGTGGVLDKFNSLNLSPSGSDGNGPNNRFHITQSWEDTIYTLSGSTLIIKDDQVEFFNGEFSGSLLKVTDQILNPQFPLNISEIPYTPIIYTNPNFDLGIFNISSFSDQYLNAPSTIPPQGKIMISTRSSFLLTYISYIKINKIDDNGNNNSIPLSQLNNILIKLDTISNYIPCEITNINEFQTYYLYEIKRSAFTNPSPINSNSEILDYQISSGISGSFDLPNFGPPFILSLTPTYNPNNFYNPFTGLYSIPYNPNTTLAYTMSFGITASGGDINLTTTFLITGSFSSPSQTIYSTTHNILNGNNQLINISNPYNGFGLGKDLYIQMKSTGLGTSSISDLSFQINQRTPSNLISSSNIIVEPFISIPNFYNSDQNPLINNASENQTSNTHFKVDYSEGVITPQNFISLLNNDGEEASIQKSNYTTKRIISPRYIGSKTTSYFINKWSVKDQDTYGKLPTIESKKTWVAFCETIGGNPPDKIDSSQIVIKYFIGEDGNIITPNINDLGLIINNNTFKTGEKVLVQTFGEIQDQPFRIIDRAASKIEPIMHNQISWGDNLDFTSSISFQQENPPSSSLIGNYQTTLGHRTDVGDHFLTYGSTWGDINFGNLISSGSDALLGIYNVTTKPSYYYEINSSSLLENIQLTLQATVTFANTNNNQASSAYIRFKNLTTGDTYGWEGVDNIPLKQSRTLSLNFSLDNNSLSPGDRIVLQAAVGKANTNPLLDSRFIIDQNPKPPSLNFDTTGLFITSSIATIYPSSSGYQFNNSLILNNEYLVKNILKSEPNQSPISNPIYQQNISGSGFYDIKTPWSINIGDEFRFEGNEAYTFMVNYYEVIDFNNTSSLVIELNKPFINGVDYNHFVLRRYVEDPSHLMVKGNKITDSVGPYLITPEYTIDSLNKNIDEYITLLTEKGLI